jgi:hypothetical protein
LSVHDGDYKKAKAALGIPEDEPIFVIRAQDRFAVPVLERYRNFVTAIKDPRNEDDETWLRQLRESIDTFMQFQDENPNKLKSPD